MADDGFVRAYRRVIDHDAFRDTGEAMAFVWMTMQAAWRPVRVRYKDRSIDLERGQLCTSVRDLGERFGRSKDWANRFLQRLADRDMIATVTATGVTLITVCNYDKYQLESGEAATPAKRQPRHHRDTTATQNKEGNEVKERKNPLTGATRASALPANFEPILTEAAQSIVDLWPPGMAEHELRQFKDRAVAKGETYKDWQAAFRTWIGNAEKWRKQNGRRMAGQPNIPEDPLIAAYNRACAAEEAERGTGADDFSPWLALPSAGS